LKSFKSFSEHSMCHGEVFHKRFSPKKHAFKYKMHMPMINLRHRSEIANLSPLVSYNGFNIYSFHDVDYLSQFQIDGEDLYSRALRVCLAHLKHPSDEDITCLSHKEPSVEVLMLSQWRFLNCVFNPISVYYFIRNNRLLYVMAEVSNTPWNERHIYSYAIPKDDNATWEDEKKFHVSPFNDLNMNYHWQCAFSDKRVSLNLALTRSAAVVFTANFHYQREPLNSDSFYRAIAKQPMLSLKTVVGIYWQALKLFIKRIPFYSHPKSKMEKTGE